jgi:hypothetical protein
MTNNIRKKDKVLLHRLSFSWSKFSRGSQPDATRVDMVCCCSFFCLAITCFCLLICNALQRLSSSTKVCPGQREKKGPYTLSDFGAVYFMKIVYNSTECAFLFFLYPPSPFWEKKMLYMCVYIESKMMDIFVC